DWFVHRRKIGFAYHLRWAWGLRRFAGLREMVSEGAAEVFGPQVPVGLRRAPRRWRTWDIFRNFSAAWKLLAWGRFEQRLARAQQAAFRSPAPRGDGSAAVDPAPPARRAWANSASAGEPRQHGNGPWSR